MATIQMTLDDHLAAEVEDLAKSLGTTFASFAADALRRAVVRHRYEDGKIDEETWMRAIAINPAFADLFDPSEDIYTLNDGIPFRDEV
jgi:hypothetical protein